jgi:hypothetical protein
MAFNQKFLFSQGGMVADPLGEGGALLYWTYATTDPIGTVEGAGYFNALANHPARVGSTIRVIAGLGGTLVAKDYVVSGNSNGVVTIQTLA